MVESIDHFAKNLYGLIFSKEFAFLDISIKITVITVLKHEIIVVRSLFHIVELDDIVTLATLQHLYLALQQLFKFAYLDHHVPFTFYRRIDFTAISLFVARSYPLNT